MIRQTARLIPNGNFVFIVSFVLGPLISFGIYFFVLQTEIEQVEADLAEQVSKRNLALIAEAEIITEKLMSMSALFAATNYVEKKEYSDFLKRVFHRTTETVFVAWAPRIAHKDRAAFISKNRSRDYPGLSMVTLDSSGMIVPSAEQEEYFPILHNQSFGSIGLPEGIDILQLDKYRSLLAKAEHSHEPATTITEASDSATSQKVLSIVVPVFKNHQEGEQHDLTLAGYILSEIGLGEFVEATYRSRIPSVAGLDIYLFDGDTSESQNSRLLYYHRSRSYGTDRKPLSYQELSKVQSFESYLNIAGADLIVVAAPVTKDYSPYTRPIPYIAFLVSMIFTLLVSAYLRTILLGRRKTEQEVERRTQALQASQAKISAILETVLDGIIVIDSVGKIQSYNPAAKTIFGYDRDEILGANVSMLMPTGDREAHNSYISNFLQTGEKKIIGLGREVIGLKKNGQTFPMDLSISEMSINGEKMFTGIVRDISERKKIDKMKSEFVSTISHELRTPLTSLSGSLSLVMGKAGDLLPEKHKKMLGLALRNSEKLKYLINDILDLEKITSGSMQFDCCEENLIAEAQQAIEDNIGYASQHSVKLQLEVDTDEAIIQIDKMRIQQVFSNLISNAIKFSRHGGTVSLKVERRDDRYRVSIMDTGRGIPEEFKDRIFGRFAQADSSDTRDIGGTGLGLSIAKAIVEGHGGEIGFESELDKGTVFFFDLLAAKRNT